MDGVVQLLTAPLFPWGSKKNANYFGLYENSLTRKG